MEPHLKILHAVAQAVSRSLDVEEVLRTALDELTHVTGHEISSLHLFSGDGGTLHLRGDRGLSEDLREVNRALPVGQGVIGSVAATGKTQRFNNIAESPSLFPPAKAAVRKHRIRGFVCVAIHSRGRILGTLSIGRQTSQRFQAREVALVEATADQIGIALDNARLYSETVRQLEELRRAQAQLIHAEKLSAVGELASGVAHEINNPLTTILGQAHLLLGREEVGEHVRDRLLLISEEASRAARIVQNLLLFSRHYPPERRPCSLADQVRRVLELTAYQLQQDDILIVTEFDETCPPVYADDNQVQQVLLNLVQNAHQAMAKQPTERVLTMRVRATERGGVVDVLDTGPGIPVEALPRLFDPFFTTKPPGEGSGLGLSVSYGIVAEHGGRLSAGNRPEGGASFSVELPGGDWA
ncbi:MAG TPA: ATP-binding protein [Methylomirabilota bacterium]|jgi:two-component system NtrC family sensor kinase|nr:ATP-binding protein [Methylomirabilota bacterium]HEV8617298.1 ATP-binding protein [Methylomirabilota bacterium]